MTSNLVIAPLSHPASQKHHPKTCLLRWIDGTQAGAVYVFTRLPAESAGAGLKCELDREGDVAGAWEGVERFKLQAHDAVAADRFGSAVSYLASSESNPPYGISLDPFGPILVASTLTPVKKKNAQWQSCGRDRFHQSREDAHRHTHTSLIPALGAGARDFNVSFHPRRALISTRRRSVPCLSGPPTQIRLGPTPGPFTSSTRGLPALSLPRRSSASR